MSLSRQRGIALLVAIVMFAIATTVAAAITYNKAMAARRAAATFALEQALQAGMAAEAFADLVLQDNGNSTRTQVNDTWAQPFGPIEIEGTGIWIQTQLEDLTSRFNLNSLVTWSGPPVNEYVVDQHQLDVFRTLLSSVQVDARYADLLTDWIDTGLTPQPTNGGEDTLYLTQVPPYRPPNTFIVHTSEMLALPGFGAANFAKISPLITALPTDEKVNPCTASGLVLDAVESMNQQSFSTQDLSIPRKNGCFPTAQQFTSGIGNPQVQSAVQTHLNMRSSWFRLRTNIRIGTAEFVLYSVLFREQNNQVRTVRRSFGSE